LGRARIGLDLDLCLELDVEESACAQRQSDGLDRVGRAARLGAAARHIAGHLDGDDAAIRDHLQLVTELLERVGDLGLRGVGAFRTLARGGTHHRAGPYSNTTWVGGSLSIALGLRYCRGRRLRLRVGRAGSR